ncbi:MAG: hypothetical protein PHH37_13830 [Paludibacter sp.]|nr:hypothetical protein [Paludibacter sp.]
MKIYHIVIFFLLISFTSCNDAVESPYPNVTPVQKSGLPTKGRSSAVSFVINDKAYITLGRTGLRTGKVADVWQYDPDNDSWSQKANFPGIGRVKAIAQVVDGKAYVGLGFDSDSTVYKPNSYLNDFWMYNPDNDTWIRKTDFPGTKKNNVYYSDACVSFVYGHYIIVGSGFDGYSFRPQFWKYDTTNDQWEQLSDFPYYGRAAATACTDGERYFFGSGYNTRSRKDWWEYFPATDSWKEKESLPENGRENAVSFSTENRFFVATGRHFGGTLTTNEFKSDILEYDADNNCWYRRGNLAQGRENAICFVIKNKAYIGFGDNDEEVFNDLWCIEP